MLAPTPKSQFLIQVGDTRSILKTWPSNTFHCCVTSPPYFGLRDYGMSGQIGLEQTPEQFVAELVSVFREVKRVLRDDGTLWLNLGDSYAGSGRGGKPDAGTKQGTNKGSQTVGVLYGREQESAEAERARMKSQNAALYSTGIKSKDLIGIPWMVAFALRADGWYLRQDIIWHKPNPMPESVRDRCTKAHEYIFLLSKSEKYFFDADAIAEPATYSGLANQDASGFKAPQSFNGKHKTGYRSSGNKTHKAVTEYEQSDSEEHRTKAGLLKISGKEYATRNKRSVWTIPPKPFKEAHFATFPPALVEPCIKAGCPVGGAVMDPFAGAGTTGLVAVTNQRHAFMVELNPEYAAMATKRIQTAQENL
jgi:DNA modification methylase